MNSSTAEEAEAYAEQAGAIEKCPRCREHYVWSGSQKADLGAYNRAWRAWKKQERGFRAMTWDEVKGIVKGVLEEARNSSCRFDVLKD
jgi:hypothetical protein